MYTHTPKTKLHILIIYFVKSGAKVPEPLSVLNLIRKMVANTKIIFYMLSVRIDFSFVKLEYTTGDIRPHRLRWNILFCEFMNFDDMLMMVLYKKCHISTIKLSNEGAPLNCDVKIVVKNSEVKDSEKGS